VVVRERPCLTRGNEAARSDLGSLASIRAMRPGAGQILCSAHGRALVESAHGRRDMGRGPVAQDSIVLLFLFCFS
jgi:hypothetical protein